jgi:hypothetical protein
MKTLVTLIATLATVSVFAAEPSKPTTSPAVTPPAVQEMKLAKKVDHTKSQPAKSKAPSKDTKKAETTKK